MSITPYGGTNSHRRRHSKLSLHSSVFVRTELTEDNYIDKISADPSSGHNTKSKRKNMESFTPFSNRLPSFSLNYPDDALRIILPWPKNISGFILTTILLIITGASFIPTALSISSPPSFIREPPRNLIYDSRILVTLECAAEGEPEPTYYWKKNSLRYDPSANEGRVIMVHGKGTLTITRPIYDDEGLYQCFSTNQYGTAVSQAALLKHARLESFPRMAKPATIRVRNGDPLTLSCLPPKGVPTPHIFWMISDDFKEVKCSSRIMQDMDGNLNFAYVNASEDIQLFGGRVNPYTCVANNPTLNTLNQGEFQIIQVENPGSPISYRPPERMWTSSVINTVLKTQKLVLRCVYSGMPAPKYTWRKLNGELPSGRWGTDCYNHEFHINNVDYSDAGDYECLAANGIGQDQKRVMSVKVEAAPSWKIKPQNSNAAEDETFEFKCEAEGLPEPSIQWLFNGLPISDAPENERRQIKGGTIIINNLKKDADIGVYQCNASNSHGYIFTNAYLNILAEPPVFQKPPKPLYELVDDSTANLTCVTFGAPAPRVTWFKDGVEITGGRYEFQGGVDSRTTGNFPKNTPDGRYLVIRNVVHSDAGNYTCVAKNKFGSVTQSGQLLVKTHTIIQTVPQNGEIRIGEPIVFRCSAVPDLSLTLEIDWEKNGEPIFGSSNRDLNRFEGHNPTMENNDEDILNEIERNEISSSHGINTGAKTSHMLDDDPNRIFSPDRNGYFGLDSSSDLRQHGNGFDSDRLADLDLDNQRVFKNPIDNSLTITNAQQTDTASYTCVARTRLDEARATANLTVQDVPNPPTDINLVSCMSRSAVVSWKPGGDNSAPIIRFVIQYNVSSPYYYYHHSPKSDNTELDQSSNTAADMNKIDISSHNVWYDYPDHVPPGERQYTVELKPYANYTFRVLAENKIGKSSIPSDMMASKANNPAGGNVAGGLGGTPLSNGGAATLGSSTFITRVCSTPPDVPQVNPTNVRAEGPNPDKLDISWTSTPAIERGGPGFHYLVRYRKMADSDVSAAQIADNNDGRGTDLTAFETVAVMDAERSTLSIPNQPTFVPYEVSVTSVNDLGQARIPPVPVIGYSGEDVPISAVPNFRLIDILGPETARVAWEKPRLESLNGKFGGYKISSYTPAEGLDKARETIVSDADQKTVIVKTLKPYSTNIVTIRIFNTYYDGPMSQEIRLQTPEGTPEMVENLQIYALGSNAIQLRWIQPSEPNGVLTGYRIFYSKVVNVDIYPEQELFPAITDPNILDARIPGLETDTKYRVMIAATTQAGLGKADWKEVKTARAGSPAPPSFTITRIEPKRVNVTWVPGGGAPPRVAAFGSDGNVFEPEINPGSLFYVQYRIKGDDFWHRTDDQFMDDWETIHDLQPATLYQIRVVAQNDKFTTSSDIKEINTLPTSSERVARARWFIGMMCALAILLLVMIIICLIRRNRGGKYPVHDKEKAKGIDPDNPDGFDEDEKTPFNATSGLGGLKPKRSSSSRGGMPPDDPHHPLHPHHLINGASESDSLAEYYADLETGKFDEDGSFIGQYGRGRNSTSTTPGIGLANGGRGISTTSTGAGSIVANRSSINNNNNGQISQSQTVDPSGGGRGGGAASLATFV